MNFKKYMNSDYLKSNPLCGIDTYKDELNLATGACTRRIKKLVLDGTENWKTTMEGRARIFYISNSQIPNNMILCTHYVVRGWDDAKYNDNSINVSYTYARQSINIHMNTYSTVADFKSYLADQYAAGTPVTVWYVLATPTTETITVPSGLSGTEEGYLNQSGTPTPSNPIYPTANTVEQWFDINHYIMGTSTDTITTPADIYADGNNATVGLVGNMSQTGTPTPTTPIQPQETGDRTGNLFDSSTIEVGGLSPTTGAETTDNTRRRSGFISVEPSTNYGLSREITSSGSFFWVIAYDENKNIVTDATVSAQFSGVLVAGTGLTVNQWTFTTTPTTKYIRWYVTVNNSYKNIMLNTGSTALPYEPYGYKIPILNNSQTTNVYLGEVETTRAIRKYVFNGTEGWQRTSNGAYYLPSASNPMSNYKYISADISINSHFPSQGTVTASSFVNDGKSAFFYIASSGTREYYIAARNIPTADDFKAYLAAQYAAGTPVTVWYVLANPETGIVNEPIRKIGDYADTVSGITIPTIAGANTLSIGTTLQPSEVTVNYKGWHPVQSVHERESGQWD